MKGLERSRKYCGRSAFPRSCWNNRYVCRNSEADTSIDQFGTLAFSISSDRLEPSLQSLEVAYVGWVSVPKLKFSKDYLQRLTKPIPKKDPNMRAAAPTETLSEPRHPTGFHQYCTNCGRDQLFSVDTLGWKTCTVCRVTAPDRSQSPI